MVKLTLLVLGLECSTGKSILKSLFRFFLYLQIEADKLKSDNAKYRPFMVDFLLPENPRDKVT